MKTSSVLVAAAALFAAVTAAYTQPPPDERPSLPPIVLEPGVKLPPPAPADIVKPSALPPLPPVVPAPLPVPQPIFPAAKAEPTKLPIVPPPPVAPLPPPAAPKLPAVPPPAAPLPLPTPLPQVPPAQPLPLPPPPPQTVTPTLPPSAGSVVVLQDGKVVEGHVSRIEDKVIVRRGGADQKYQTEQVKYVAASKDEAYRLALKDTKADDAAARLRLARWCMVTGMRENALAEAKEAARLEPANRTATGLVRTLEESLRLFPGDGTVRVSSPTPTPSAPPAPGLPAVPPPPPSPPVVPVVTVPDVDVAAEAVVAFGPRVQPVLMNQCASCHAQPHHTSGYRLTTVTSNEVNAAATRANLAATAAQVKKADPAASPLLVKATTAHGGQAAPAFADREAAPYRVMQAWAYLTRGELAPPVAAASPVVTPTLPPPPALPMVPPVALPLAPPPIPPAEGSIPPIPPASDSPGFGRTAPPPIPVVPAKDDFDPDNFNRR
ncbi:MAG TPA: hypothetical protein VD866_02525 [Urbifossiella sp.]|nr:hypothetical protein [Urbifossiella sp.]